MAEGMSVELAFGPVRDRSEKLLFPRVLRISLFGTVH